MIATETTTLPIRVIIDQRGGQPNRWGRKRRTWFEARVGAEPGYSVAPAFAAMVGRGDTADAACADLLRQVSQPLQARTASTCNRVVITGTATGTTTTIRIAT